jgi:hypothetical protein
MKALVNFILLAAAVSATLMESLRAIPEGWKLAGVPGESTRLHFRISMVQVSP